MRQLNPSPYGFFINLGEEEYLVGASPEMYVRVQGNRVETCPISGTIKRGAEVSTVRFDKALAYLQEGNYDLVVLSPGPGKPRDFNLSETIAVVGARGIPLFGVCLGLQGIVEHFGGVLDVLEYPMHGKPSMMNVLDSSGLFADLGETFKAGRYHSLYARLTAIPEELQVTAMSDDGIVMAVSHKHLPVHAVQFHPETILSLGNQAGLKIITNLMRMVPAHGQ
jgi:anthranilate synthase